MLCHFDSKPYKCLTKFDPGDLECCYDVIDKPLVALSPA